MALALLFCTLLGGCGKQSTLSPRSPQTHQISLLWWWMLGAATVVFLGAVGMLAMAWRRRRTAGLPIFGEREDLSHGLVLMFGIGIPVVALVALFSVANVYVVSDTQAPPPRTTQLTVEVKGHQWWWEFRYPGSPAVTANELHIPVGTRVNVVGTAADVIHSFWVPQLARKVDLIPGKENRILLYAPQAGTYRGQCSEFCGFQHAHMSMYVVAQPSSQFRAWLAAEAPPAKTPTGRSAAAGQRLFMTSQCASCHQIRGTSAQGLVGPDLTHVASRRTLAAGLIPNDPAHLAAWIDNPQAIKPGTLMPDLGLSKADVAEIVSYLDSLG